MRNITETEEFVWNLATRDLAEAMNETSATLPHGEDEFTFAGLTPVASQLVSSPRVAESPVNFECRLSQCIQLTGADGTPIDTGWCSAKWWASISLRVCWKRIYQTAKAQPILRAGGPSAYYGISDSHRFDLVRPDARRNNQ